MRALAQDSNGVVVGALYDFIARPMTAEDFPYFAASWPSLLEVNLRDLERWQEQIISAVKHLHEHGKTWGNIQPDHIWISPVIHGRDAVLSSFIKTYDKHCWVDRDLVGSVEGDLQGLRRICEWINDGMKPIPELAKPPSGGKPPTFSEFLSYKEMHKLEKRTSTMLELGTSYAYQVQLVYKEKWAYDVIVPHNKEDPRAFENIHLDQLKRIFCEDYGIYEQEQDWSARRYSSDQETLFAYLYPALYEYAREVELTHAPELPIGRGCTVKTLRINSMSGKPAVFESDHKPITYCTNGVPNTFPGIKTVNEAEISFGRKIDLHIYEVCLNGERYIFKDISASANEYIFILEIETFQGLPTHPNVIHLQAVVQDSQKLVTGALYGFIPDPRVLHLNSSRFMGPEEPKKWQEQFTSAVKHLHKHGRTVGSFSPENFWIDADRNAVLSANNGRLGLGPWPVKRDLLAFEKFLEWFEEKIGERDQE